MLSRMQPAADSLPERADGVQRAKKQRGRRAANPSDATFALPPPNITLFLARFKNLDSFLNEGANHADDDDGNSDYDDEDGEDERIANSRSASFKDGTRGVAGRTRKEERGLVSSDSSNLKDAGAASSSVWEMRHTVTFPTPAAQDLRQQLLSEVAQVERQLGNHAGELRKAIEERIQPLRHVSYFDAVVKQKRDEVEANARGYESELSMDVPLDFPCLGGQELDVKQLVLEAVQSIWVTQSTQAKDVRPNYCGSNGERVSHDAVPGNRRSSRHRNEEEGLFWALTNSVAALHILQDMVWYFYLEFFALAELDERFEIHRLRALTDVLEKEVIHAQRMRNNALLAHTRGRNDNALTSVTDVPDADTPAPSPVNYAQLQQLAANAEKRIATMQQYSNFTVQAPQPLAYGPLHLRTSSEAHNVPVADPKAASRRRHFMASTQSERFTSERPSSRNSSPGVGGVLALLNMLAGGANGGASETLRATTPLPYDTAFEKDTRLSEASDAPEGPSDGLLDKFSCIDPDVLTVYFPEALDACTRYEESTDDWRRSKQSCSGSRYESEGVNTTLTCTQDVTQRNCGQVLRDALYVSLPLEPDLLVAGEINLRRAIDVIAFSEGLRPDMEQISPTGSSSVKGACLDEPSNSPGSGGGGASLYCRKNVEKILAESENSRSGLRSCIIAAHASRVVRLAQKRVFRRLARNFTLLLLSLVQMQEKQQQQQQQQLAVDKSGKRLSTEPLPSVAGASGASQTQRAASAQSNKQLSSDHAAHKTCDLATLLCAHGATVWTAVTIQILSVVMPFTKDLWTAALVQHMMRRVTFWVQGVENDTVSHLNLGELVHRAERCLTRIPSPTREGAQREAAVNEDTSPRISSQGASPGTQPTSSKIEPEVCLSAGALSPVPLIQHLPPTQASRTQPPSPGVLRTAGPTSPDHSHASKGRQRSSPSERSPGNRTRPNAYYTAAYKDIVAIFERIVHDHQQQQAPNEDKAVKARAVLQMGRFHTVSSGGASNNNPHASGRAPSRSPTRRVNRKQATRDTRKSSSRSPRSLDHPSQLPNLSLPPSATSRLPWNESGKRANTIAVRRGNAHNNGGGLSGILRSLIVSGLQLPTSASSGTPESLHEIDGIAGVMATLLPEFTRVVVEDQLARSGAGQSGSGMASAVSSTHRSATAAAPGYAFLTYVSEDERNLLETRKAIAQQTNRPQQLQQVQREYFDLTSVSPLLHAFMKDESIPLPHSAVRVLTSQVKMGLMRWS